MQWNSWEATTAMLVSIDNCPGQRGRLTVAAAIYGATNPAYSLSQGRSNGNGITYPGKTLKGDFLHSRINPHRYKRANDSPIETEGGEANKIKDVFRMGHIVVPLNNNQPGSDKAADNAPEKEVINSILRDVHPFRLA